MPTLLTESSSEVADPSLVSTDATPNKRRSSVVPQRADGASERTESIQRRAIRQIEEHPLFRGRAKLLNVSFESGTLTIDGRLPSFYLKQVLQETLRDLDGIEQINNRVDVN